MTVDLRSDTVTQPSAGMRRAMADAVVADAVLGEDPTVNALEARVADLLGHEAGLFCPSGSMANQLGLRMLIGPGQEVLCDVEAHIVRAELGAAAVFSGITTRTVAGRRGLLDPDQYAAAMTPRAGPYMVSTVAFAVENTHNFGGGTVQPLDRLQGIRAIASAAGLAVHLDGARLWNAHVATGVPLATYGVLADTVSVCLSKGLGAPVGSVLVSSAERIAAARVWRKRMGGGMRQVGILAAAGHYALDHNVARLSDDHARARRIAELVAAGTNGVVDPEAVDTNIVMLDLSASDKDAATLVGQARERGILLSAMGPRKVRVTTHLDVDDAGAQLTGDVLRSLLSG